MGKWKEAGPGNSLLRYLMNQPRIYSDFLLCKIIKFSYYYFFFSYYLNHL